MTRPISAAPTGTKVEISHRDNGNDKDDQVAGLVKMTRIAQKIDTSTTRLAKKRLLVTYAGGPDPLATAKAERETFEKTIGQVKGHNVEHYVVLTQATHEDLSDAVYSNHSAAKARDLNVQPNILTQQQLNTMLDGMVENGEMRKLKQFVGAPVFGEGIYDYSARHAGDAANMQKWRGIPKELDIQCDLQPIVQKETKSIIGQKVGSYNAMEGAPSPQAPLNHDRSLLEDQIVTWNGLGNGNTSLVSGQIAKDNIKIKTASEQPNPGITQSNLALVEEKVIGWVIDDPKPGRDHEDMHYYQKNMATPWSATKSGGLPGGMGLDRLDGVTISVDKNGQVQHLLDRSIIEQNRQDFFNNDVFNAVNAYIASVGGQKLQNPAQLEQLIRKTHIQELQKLALEAGVDDSTVSQIDTVKKLLDVAGKKFPNATYAFVPGVLKPRVKAADPVVKAAIDAMDDPKTAGKKNSELAAIISKANFNQTEFDTIAEQTRSVVKEVGGNNAREEFRLKSVHPDSVIASIVKPDHDPAGGNVYVYDKGNYKNSPLYKDLINNTRGRIIAAGLNMVDASDA